MQPWLDTGEDVVGLEADDVVEEATELISLRLDLDGGASIFADKFDVRVHLGLKILHLALNLVDEVLLLKHVQELLALVQLRLHLDTVGNVLLEVPHLIQRAGGEIFGGWVVLLDRFKVTDDVGRAFFLLVACLDLDALALKR